MPITTRFTVTLSPVNTGSMFTDETLRFLRALKRNNDREWFRERRERYDTHVRGPMIQLIERLALDFRRFAPEIVASPKTSLYRVYRDTRFSGDKTPLKIQASASFRWRGLARGEGAGLYLEVHPQWVWMGGGFWAPPMPQLVRIREHIAAQRCACDIRNPRGACCLGDVMAAVKRLEGATLSVKED